MRRLLGVTVLIVICAVLVLALGPMKIRPLENENNFQFTSATALAADNRTRSSGVHALGRLEPKGTILRVAAPSGNEGNRLESLYVEEGVKVVKGELLGRMDTYARRLASKVQEEARLATAMAKLSQVKAGSKQGDIDAAKAAVDSAERDLETKLRERIVRIY